jgi:catechol 2,3-dioxygenase-like lactoylglutathione lyase family enzyme
VIDHVTIRVADREEARAFYDRAPGLLGGMQTGDITAFRSGAFSLAHGSPSGRRPQRVQGRACASDLTAVRGASRSDGSRCRRESHEGVEPPLGERERGPGSDPGPRLFHVDSSREWSPL